MGKIIFSTLVVSAIGLGLLGQMKIEGIVQQMAIAATVTNAQIDRPVRVELGSKAIYNTERLEIQVISISDGRCPQDVRCAWGGKAKVTLNVRQHDLDVGDLVLTLGTGNPEYSSTNNIKKVGAYYLRVLAVEPYPAGNRTTPTATQTVTLQVQKTPFKLKDAELDPKLRSRPLDQVKLGSQFALLNNQSAFLGNAQNVAYTQISFDVRPIDNRSDLVDIFVGIQSVGSPTLLNQIRQTIKLGTPLQIANRAGGFKLQLFAVKSFTEDTRSGLNFKSPLGYRAILRVDEMSK